jgi:hypothetical protein
MTDASSSFSEHRAMRPDEVVVCNRLVTHHGADLQRAVDCLDAGQSVQVSQVNQFGRLGEPEVHHRDQTLTSGYDLGRITMFGQEFQRFVQ